MSTTLSQARAFGKPGGAVENVLLDENKALRDRYNDFDINSTATLSSLASTNPVTAVP